MFLLCFTTLFRLTYGNKTKKKHPKDCIIVSMSIYQAENAQLTQFDRHYMKKPYFFWIFKQNRCEKVIG